MASPKLSRRAEQRPAEFSHRMAALERLALCWHPVGYFIPGGGSRCEAGKPPPGVPTCRTKPTVAGYCPVLDASGLFRLDDLHAQLGYEAVEHIHRAPANSSSLTMITSRRSP